MLGNLPPTTHRQIPSDQHEQPNHSAVCVAAWQRGQVFQLESHAGMPDERAAHTTPVPERTHRLWPSSRRCCCCRGHPRKRSLHVSALLLVLLFICGGGGGGGCVLSYRRCAGPALARRRRALTPSHWDVRATAGVRWSSLGAHSCCYTHIQKRLFPPGMQHVACVLGLLPPICAAYTRPHPFLPGGLGIQSEPVPQTAVLGAVSGWRSDCWSILLHCRTGPSLAAATAATAAAADKGQRSRRQQDSHGAMHALSACPGCF